MYQKRDAHRTPKQGQQQILGGTEDRICSITQWESHDQQHTAPPGQQLGPEDDHTEKYRANEQYQCAADPNGLERSLSLHHADRRDDGNDRVAGKGHHRPDSAQAPVSRHSAVHRVNAQQRNQHCDVCKEYGSKIEITGGGVIRRLDRTQLVEDG